MAGAGQDGAVARSAGDNPPAKFFLGTEARRDMAGQTVSCALMLLVLLSGCADRSPTEFATTTNPGLVPIGDGTASGTAAPKPAPSNGTVADNVAIDEEGDLTEGMTRSWNWTVQGGFRDFRVQLDIEGFQGSPLVEVNDVRYELRGAGEVRVSGGMTLVGGSPRCLVCFNGMEDENPYGDWQLDLAVDPSLARYRLSVDVTY